MLAVLDEIMGYQQFNELLKLEGHTDPTGDSSPENGEVRLRESGGYYYLQKYVSGAWVDAHSRLVSGRFFNRTGEVDKGLTFDNDDGDARFKQDLAVEGALAVTGNVSMGNGVPFPFGGIAIFDTTCPAGWTRVSAFDGKTLKGASSYGGTGGSATHSHTVDIQSQTTGSTSIRLYCNFTTTGNVGARDVYDDPRVPVANTVHYHYVQGYTDYDSHSHSFDVYGSTWTASSWPPYIEVVFCKAPAS